MHTQRASVPALPAWLPRSHRSRRGARACVVPLGSGRPAAGAGAAAPAETRRVRRGCGAGTDDRSRPLQGLADPGAGVRPWLGVSPTPHDVGVSYDQALVDFEERIDRTVDIVHYYTRGEQLVPDQRACSSARTSRAGNASS